MKFPDNHEEEYQANVIAESMFSQCDTEGNQYLLLDDIVAQRMESKG